MEATAKINVSPHVIESRSQLSEWKSELKNRLKFANNSVDSKPDPRVTTEPRRVLLVDPSHFRIESTLNVHMQNASGKLNQVNKEKARSQWQNLVKAYDQTQAQPTVINPESTLPDIVFCANQTFPFLAADGSPHVLLSEMRSPTRKPEVVHFQKFFESQNYTCHQAPFHDDRPGGICFEGMGDLLPVAHPDLGPVLLAGTGPRTDRQALDWISSETGLTVIALQLPHPKFYHLDTCLSILKRGNLKEGPSALACKEGFSEESFGILEDVFSHLIQAPLNESDSPGFACNCHCPDGKNVLIQAGNLQTNAALQKAGYTVIELDTSEFIKAGGSVFCMKMMFY